MFRLFLSVNDLLYHIEVTLARTLQAVLFYWSSYEPYEIPPVS